MPSPRRIAALALAALLAACGDPVTPTATSGPLREVPTATTVAAAPPTATATIAPTAAIPTRAASPTQVTPVARQTFAGKQGVRQIAFSPDGKLLVSGDERGDVILWDLVGGKC